jgi:16S rRNA G966 N2-methylase RsmD
VTEMRMRQEIDGMPGSASDRKARSAATEKGGAAWACRRVFTSLKDVGVGQTADLIRKNLAGCARQYVNRRFDRRFHVDTAGVTQLADLTCESSNKEHGVLYEPTPLKTLKCMFSMLPADLSDFTFIDFGSGKGRTLLYASNYNFRRIIGVEFAKELHAVAQQNIRTYRSRTRKCQDMTSFCSDATEFSLPEEDSVLYFFHPFREPVMRKVLDNIEQSYRRCPRKLIVLYYHPRLNGLIQSVSFLRKRQERPVPFDLSAEPCIYRRRLELYETIGASDGPNMLVKSTGIRLAVIGEPGGSSGKRIDGIQREGR